MGKLIEIKGYSSYYIDSDTKNIVRLKNNITTIIPIKYQRCHKYKYVSLVNSKGISTMVSYDKLIRDYCINIDESFVDIEGYEGLYKINPFGKVINCSNNRELIKTKKDGYFYVSLRKDSKLKKNLVHRLLAKAFIPNPNNYPCINHKDENRSNNSLDNLEWCTYEYNSNYGTRNKRLSEISSEKCGVKCKAVNIITNEVIIANTVRELSKLIGFKYQTVYAHLRDKIQLGNYKLLKDGAI